VEKTIFRITKCEMPNALTTEMKPIPSLRRRRTAKIVLFTHKTAER
jgi:hypothetical protein